MNSSTPPAAWPFALPAVPLPLPMVQGTIRAGFPSPADDFAVKRHDLNELLITHPAATFFWRVRGTSMAGAGITDGDILIVNRALVPAHGDIVVAEVDSDFTVKYLYQRGGRVRLKAADETFPDITFEKEGRTLAVVGVVTAAVKQFRAAPARSASAPGRSLSPRA